MKRPLLHPLALSSLAVLVVNDHVLKRIAPSFLTGKLSDFAGVFLLPLVLAAAFELGATKALGRAPSPRVKNSALLLSVAITAAGFACVELLPSAEVVYGYLLGALQWPFWATVSTIAGDALPGILAVQATADPTDLLALPMGLVALHIGWQPRPGERTPRMPRASRNAAGIAVLLALGLIPIPARAAPAQNTPDCFAKGAYTHNGFFLSGGLGMGALFVDSDAAISNGFQQPIPSSANGFVFPVLDLAIGGTLRDPLLVIGARYMQADSREPTIHTLDESFTVPDFRLGFREFSLFGRYYLDPHLGTHIGGSVGFFSLYAGEVQDALSDDFYPGSEQQNGVGLSLEGGQDFWIMKEVSFGLTLRLAFARLSNDSNTTLVFAPTLLGSLVFH